MKECRGCKPVALVFYIADETSLFIELNNMNI